MTIQDYIDMGFTKEDAEFVQAYPKLFATASTYGISKQEIDNIFNQLDNSTWMRTQTNHKTKQIYLQGMLFRLYYFNKSFELKEYKKLNVQEISDLFGKRNSKFAEELLKVIWNSNIIRLWGSGYLKNEYTIEDGHVRMKLVSKKDGVHYTLFDLHYIDKVINSKLSWHLKWDSSLQSYYCKATKYLGLKDGKPKYKTVYFHRFITDTLDSDYYIDHMNHDTLDNRLDNLKITTQQDNTRNRRGANRNSATGVRNVSYDVRKEMYIVQLQVKGVNTVVGEFTTLEGAKQFATNKRKELYNKDIV